MSQFHALAAIAGRSLIFAILATSVIYAQGGKELIEWLEEYSPTGYFIINDYETRADIIGDHKKWLGNETSPLGAVAVHESGHMRNLAELSSGSEKSYYIGNLEDFRIIFDFDPYSSREILDDIPMELRNFQTEVYIEAGEGNYSVGWGLIGIMEEWNQYITGLKSGVEMAECYKEHFDTPQFWGALANDVTTSVWSNAEFRYFCLRYIIYARENYPDVYSGIVEDPNLHQLYTHMVNFAEQTMAEWIAVLAEQEMDTTTRHGFDWHWKFWEEIQKPEYKEIEELILIQPVHINFSHYSDFNMLEENRFGPLTTYYDIRGKNYFERGYARINFPQSKMLR